MKDSVSVDVQKVTPQSGDIYMLCSDGLSGMVSDEAIAEAINQGGRDLEKVCESLITRANAGGGQDNITVVLVEFAE
jgi:serine/threonine protein phosphatase PrpC